MRNKLTEEYKRTDFFEQNQKYLDSFDHRKNPDSKTKWDREINAFPNNFYYAEAKSILFVHDLTQKLFVDYFLENIHLVYENVIRKPQDLLSQKLEVGGLIIENSIKYSDKLNVFYKLYRLYSKVLNVMFFNVEMKNYLEKYTVFVNKYSVDINAISIPKQYDSVKFGKLNFKLPFNKDYYYDKASLNESYLIFEKMFDEFDSLIEYRKVVKKTSIVNTFGFNKVLLKFERPHLKQVLELINSLGFQFIDDSTFYSDNSEHFIIFMDDTYCYILQINKNLVTKKY